MRLDDALFDLGLDVTPFGLLRLDRRISGPKLGAKPDDVVGALLVRGFAEHRNGPLAREAELFEIGIELAELPPRPGANRARVDRGAGTGAHAVVGAHRAASDSTLPRPACDLGTYPPERR